MLSAAEMLLILIYYQLEYLEMQVEAEVLRRNGSAQRNSSFASYVDSFRRLFSKQYIDRTLIGVMIMFFQRLFHVVT